ncbi:MAG: hypothetical protein ACYCWE_02320 [Eubacteriales bacterium]
MWSPVAGLSKILKVRSFAALRMTTGKADDNEGAAIGGERATTEMTCKKGSVPRNVILNVWNSMNSMVKELNFYTFKIKSREQTPSRVIVICNYVSKNIA